MTALPRTFAFLLGGLLLTGLVLAAAIGPYTMVASSPVSAYRLNRWTGEMLFCLRGTCAYAEPRSVMDMSFDEIMNTNPETLKWALEVDRKKREVE